MKVKNLDSLISQILEQETRKIIKEQISETDHTMDSIKNLQSLSGISDKISNIEDIGNGNFGVNITINGVTEEELTQCCGGSSLEEAQKNLMQGIHHDLEDNGMGSDFDIDINGEDGENGLNLTIKITAITDETLGDGNMKKNEKSVESIDEKKEILLGDKKICEKCGKESDKDICDECGTVKESRKKTITLTGAKMTELLERIVSEAIPGIDTANRVHHDSGRQNAEALKDVEKKIKKYLTFKGNDNPEFPNQIGGEKMARKNSDEQDEIVDDNRGRGPQDLEYDTDGIDNNEESKKFKDRLTKSLTGDKEMGNSQDAAGVIKSKTGEKMVKNIKKRQDNYKKEPVYPKEAIPTKTNEKEPTRTINEDVEKMKKLYTYNKKTQ